MNLRDCIFTLIKDQKPTSRRSRAKRSERGLFDSNTRASRDIFARDVGRITKMSDSNNSITIYFDFFCV